MYIFEDNFKFRYILSFGVILNFDFESSVSEIYFKYKYNY